MTTRYEELEKLAKEAAQGQWCKDYCYSAIKHVARNCDIECLSHDDGEECPGGFGRYDGPYVAAACPETILSLLSENRAMRELLPKIKEDHNAPYRYRNSTCPCFMCKQISALLSPESRVKE